MAGGKEIVLVFLAILVQLSSQRSKYGHYRHDYHIIKHAVDLDTITFDKVISHQNVTVVLFMHYLSYGPKQTEFKKFAESTVTQPEVVAATVGVIDEVDMTNWELAERFNITMEQLPLVKLFIGSKEIATMEGEMNCENMRQFVRQTTGMWIGRTGTLEYLDQIAVSFLQARTDGEKEELIEGLRQFKEKNATEDEHIKSATYYIRICEEYMKHGPAFLGLESGRLKALIARHKFHEQNKCGIRKQQNILQTFQQTNVHIPHDEL